MDVRKNDIFHWKDSSVTESRDQICTTGKYHAHAPYFIVFFGLSGTTTYIHISIYPHYLTKDTNFEKSYLT